MASRKIQPNSPFLKQVRRVIIITGVGIAFFEIFVHYLQNGIHVDWYLFLEAAFLAIVLPVIGTLLLNYFQTSENSRLQAFEVLNHQVAVSRHFSTTSEWNELIGWLVEYPSTILPMQKVSIFLKDGQSGQLDLAAIWSKGQTGLAELGLTATPHPCNLCQSGRLDFHQLTPPEGTVILPETIYCLPLVLGETLVGLIQMLASGPLPVSGIQILNNIAPEFALALDHARLQRVAANQVEANEADRKRIARDLHDTLGQSVAYLHLRLEHLLLSSDPAHQIGEIRNELETMRDAANEAYHHVRDTLADLQTDTPRDLHQALFEMSRMVANRAGFEISVPQTGQPKKLGPHTRRQILYICREALYNIERHANARKVTINLDWQTKGVSLTVQDDGIGFVQDEVDISHHYGLSIMQDRAGDIKAELKVNSDPGQGTRITLWLPLESQIADVGTTESMTLLLEIQRSETQDDEAAGR
jgi:signal transduction histidine kinase